MLKLIKMNCFQFYIGNIMIKNIKKFLNWEIILFILININLVIFINIFPYLDSIFTSFIYFILAWLNKPFAEEINISFLIMLSVYLIPLFIIIKYLFLPITIWFIQKFSKNEQIKSWIANITEKNVYKMKIILIAIIIDIIALLIDYFINKDNAFMYLLFGGLTGSYAVLFLFVFIRRKFLNRKILV